jgi:transposase
MPRLKGSADLLEDRRKRALALLDSGESLNEVGRRIGCNPSSVMRWRDARRRGGAKALRVRFSPGRPLKLDRTQRRRLVNLLLQGPMMHGYRTNLWTTARIAELIRKQFGIQYHRDHVGRLMHSLNQDLVPARLYPNSLSSPATARQGLGHFGNLRKLPPPTPGSVLSTLFRQHRARRSLPVSARAVAPLAGPGDRGPGQFFHPQGSPSPTSAATT